MLLAIFRPGRRGLAGVLGGLALGGAVVAGYALQGRPIGTDVPGGSVGSVSFSVPAQEAFEADLFHLRRGFVGCNTSRMWVALDSGGTTYVVSGDCNGSRADPTVYVSSLSGATHAFANLGSSDQTSADTAADFVTALAGLGLSASVTGVDGDGDSIITVDNASNLVIPAAVATNNALRGMWGGQRDDWGSGGAGQSLNADGGTNGTGSIHLNPLSADADIPAATDARILGVYVFGAGGFTPLLAAGTGPVYALDPAAITVVGEGQIASGLTGGAVGYVLFDDPAPITTDDELWAIYRGDAATAPGGPRYRPHGGTPEGSGDIPVGEQLCWDTTVDDAATTPIGATYDPTNNSNFAIYINIGLIVEVADSNGNFPADGSIDTWIGDQNTDDEHGTQVAAGPAIVDTETTHHRFLLPDWSTIPVTQVRRAVDAIGADEDSRVAFYGPWTSLTIPVPALSEPNLIADLGVLGLAGNSDQYTTLTLGSPVDISAAANAYISLGFNYVRSGGAANDTYTLPVFTEGTGDGAFLNAWVDDRDTWHDDIIGASGGRALVSGVSEYRTLGASTLPVDDLTDTFPDPFDPDPTDDSPAAIALDAYRVQVGGISIATP